MSKTKEDKKRILRRLQKLTTLISSQGGVFEKIEAGIDTIVLAKTCAEGLAGMKAANTVLADTSQLLDKVEEIHDEFTIGAEDVAEMCSILSAPLDPSQEFDEEALLAELDEAARKADAEQAATYAASGTPSGMVARNATNAARASSIAPC